MLPWAWPTHLIRLTFPTLLMSSSTLIVSSSTLLISMCAAFLSVTHSTHCNRPYLWYPNQMIIDWQHLKVCSNQVHFLYVLSQWWFDPLPRALYPSGHEAIRHQCLLHPRTRVSEMSACLSSLYQYFVPLLPPFARWHFWSTNLYCRTSESSRVVTLGIGLNWPIAMDPLPLALFLGARPAPYPWI